jgi:hypothetical protein
MRAWIVHPAADDLPAGPWIYVDARDGKVLRVSWTAPATRRLRVAAGLLALAMIVLIVALFQLGRVCDPQVIGSGKVVMACRHFRATDPPMIAAGIVIVGALSAFYSEISGFGISLKRRVDEASQAARASLQLGELNLHATQRLNETTADLADFNRGATLRFGDMVAEFADSAAGADPLARVHQLAAEYNELRGTMPSGDERTVLMNEIVQGMRSSLRASKSFDVSANLGSADRGMRLAGYAYLLDHSDPQRVSQLALAAANEDRPHPQYWALEALRHQLMTTAQPLPEDDMIKLVRAAQPLDPNSARARQINGILARERGKR